MYKKFSPILISLMRFLTRFKHGKQLHLLSKRQRFALQTIVLTAGLFATQLIWEEYRFLLVGILAIISYILTAWSLSEDVRGIEWLLLFILPVFFTVSSFLFYFLLPPRWFTRITTALVFSIGTYAILLVENIYNVAAVRSIQLLRAAQSVGLLLTLVVIFLIANIIYSLRLPYLYNMLLFVPTIFILSLQLFWSINLEERVAKNLIIYAGIVSLGIGELAFSLSFWPLPNASYSLLLTASTYVLMGMIQQHLLGRFFRNTVSEYILVFIFTLVLTLLTTKWG